MVNVCIAFDFRDIQAPSFAEKRLEYTNEGHIQESVTLANTSIFAVDDPARCISKLLGQNCQIFLQILLFCPLQTQFLPNCFDYEYQGTIYHCFDDTFTNEPRPVWVIPLEPPQPGSAKLCSQFSFSLVRNMIFHL